MIPITNYEDYYITETGEVWRNNHQLTPWLTNSGYLEVGLSKQGKIKKCYIHRLVAQMFLNNGKEFTLTVNHKDGNKLNNNVNNLEIISQSNNNKHAYQNNLKQPINAKKELNGNAKLTQKDIDFIREHYKPRDSQWSGKKLAEMFDITPANVSNIVNYKLWKN